MSDVSMINGHIDCPKVEIEREVYIVMRGGRSEILCQKEYRSNEFQPIDECKYIVFCEKEGFAKCMCEVYSGDEVVKVKERLVSLE